MARSLTGTDVKLRKISSTRGGARSRIFGSKVFVDSVLELGGFSLVTRMRAASDDWKMLFVDFKQESGVSVSCSFQ